MSVADNAINGVPACVNKELLAGKLRGDFGFTGVVATDCGALADVINAHNYSQNGVDTVTMAIQAGVDSNCGSEFGTFMPAAMGLVGHNPQPFTHKKTVNDSTLAASARRLLALRFRLGLWEPNASAVPKFGLDDVDSDAHRALALRQARQ